MRNAKCVMRNAKCVMRNAKCVMRNKRGAVVFFCRLLLSPIASIFGSGVPYTARTFLSRIAPAADRSTLSGDKVTKNRGQNKIILIIFYAEME